MPKYGNTTVPAAEGPAEDFFAVTPSNTVSFTNPARSLWVGGAGNVAVVSLTGTVVTFTGVPAGTMLPVQAARVNATNTTATNIVGLL